MTITKCLDYEGFPIFKCPDKQIYLFKHNSCSNVITSMTDTISDVQGSILLPAKLSTLKDVVSLKLSASNLKHF